MSIPLLLAKRGFHPRQLFAALQGAWLEPTPGYIWQENAGVTPTTTGGQTIGRIADQSGGGNNATQATGGNRPVLGRRYNLLTYSEDFSNAAWTKRGTASITPNEAIAPDGTLTADKVSGLNTSSNDIYSTDYQLVGAKYSNLSLTPLIWIKRISTIGQLYICNPYNTDRGQWNIDLSLLPDDWVKITQNTLGVTVVNQFTGGPIGEAGILIRAISGGPLSLYIWGADLRLTADVGKDPSYQRITTATDYDYGQYPAAVHDTNDSLTVSLPDLGSGVFSSAGSVYFATPVGMSALHNQSMGTSYTLPALSTDIYSWVVVPQRLSAVLESRLERYMLRKAGIAGPDYLLDSSNNQLTADDGEQLLLAQ